MLTVRSVSGAEAVSRADHRNPLISWVPHPAVLIPSAQRGARGPSRAEEPPLLLVKSSS